MHAVYPINFDSSKFSNSSLIAFHCANVERQKGIANICDFHPKFNFNLFQRASTINFPRKTRLGIVSFTTNSVASLPFLSRLLGILIFVLMFCQISSILKLRLFKLSWNFNFKQYLLQLFPKRQRKDKPTKRALDKKNESYSKVDL